MKRKKQVMAGGYGIMPNKVLFDKKLSSTAKLLYSFINSLCAEKGHCFASNKYLAEKFNLSESRISKSLSQLDPYLTFTDRNSDKRKIYIYDINLVENDQVPSRKRPGNLGENDIHNNISEKDKTNKVTLSNDNVANAKNDSESLIGSDQSIEHSAAAADPLTRQVQEIMAMFYEINPTLNFANKTSRGAAEWMIKKWDFETVKQMAEKVIGCQGDPYAPVATTPYDMKEKLAKFAIHFKNKDINKPRVLNL